MVPQSAFALLVEGPPIPQTPLYLWARIVMLLGGLCLLAQGGGLWWSMFRPIASRAGRWFVGRRWSDIPTDRRQRIDRGVGAAGICLLGLAYTLYAVSLFLGPPSTWAHITIPLLWFSAIYWTVAKAVVAVVAKLTNWID